MQASSPRGHHYNPEMLLKRFCNSSGKIWVNDGENVYKTNPTNVFKQRDLNATRNVIPSDSGQSYTVDLTFEHENTLSNIEDKAEPAIQRIIEQARRGRCPKLSPNQRRAWKEFYLAMTRRTPEGQAEIWQYRPYDDAFYEAASRVAEKYGVILPSKEELLQIDRVADLVDDSQHNSNARFSAGSHPILQEVEDNFIRTAGLQVAVIASPENSFIAGSCGLAIVKDSSLERWIQGAWLPVAHDVAIAPTDSPDVERIVRLDNDEKGVRTIDAINEAIAARSWKIAGPSQQLVQSLKPGRIRRPRS